MSYGCTWFLNEFTRHWRQIVADYTEDQIARMLLATLTDPADPVTGQLIHTVGLAETLDLATTPGLSVPSPVDPIAGAVWRQQAQGRYSEALSDILTALTEQHGLRLLTPGRAGWPEGVGDLGHTVPLALWAKGNPELLTSSLTSRVTITGARAVTGYGAHLTHEFATELAESPRIIVSGGAYGVDAEAHRAALATRRASTIAVFAGGVDRAYPAAHGQLFDRITDSGGLLISETPPETAPTRARFLARTRLLAALSGATVIPEAGARSGSIRVAETAYDLGRPVAAIPGPVTSAASAGCHRLMKDEIAELVTMSAEVETMLDPAPLGFRLPLAYQQAARRAAASTGRGSSRPAL